MYHHCHQTRGQSQDDVKFTQMSNIRTKKEAIRTLIYVFMIGVLFAGDFVSNAFIQKWYTTGVLDPFSTIIVSEVLVDGMFIVRIPFYKIWCGSYEEDVLPLVEKEKSMEERIARLEAIIVELRSF